jgi:ABC-type Mn2+/Zn2+ transport system permease subunit
MNDSESESFESEALSIAAEVVAAAPAPITVWRRVQATGDFISHAVAVAFLVALGAVTALAAAVIVTLLAPLFLGLFARALRQQDRIRLSRAGA